MRIIQKTSFRKDVKKLHPNQKRDLDAAIEIIIKDPAQGVRKTGDLTGFSVYKFRMVNQLTLLAYTFDGEAITLTLLAFGSHENFYRNLKK